jgi:hypothetical protein
MMGSRAGPEEIIGSIDAGATGEVHGAWEGVHRSEPRDRSASVRR